MIRLLRPILQLISSFGIGLRDDIVFQRRFLYRTIKKIGIEILDETTEIRMEDVRTALQCQHPNDSEVLFRTIRQMNESLETVVEQLYPDVKGRTVSSNCEYEITLRSVNDYQPDWQDFASRINWEWDKVRDYLKREDLKDVISRLRDWNDDLAEYGLEQRENTVNTENRVI